MQAFKNFRSLTAVWRWQQKTVSRLNSPGDGSEFDRLATFAGQKAPRNSRDVVIQWRIYAKWRPWQSLNVRPL